MFLNQNSLKFGNNLFSKPLQNTQNFLEEPIIKEIVQIIKKEASLSCSICHYDYETLVRYPVQVCPNKHSYCKVCVDSFKPGPNKVNLNSSFNISNRNLLNKPLVPCPDCKVEFVKEQVQKNRIIVNLILETIPKVKNALREHIKVKNRQSDDLIMKKTNQVRQGLLKQISMLQRLVAEKKQQFAAYKLQKETQITKLNSECNIYRGLPELNTISAQTIKLLSQENDKLTTQLHSLRSQFVKNYTLFAGKPSQLLASNKKKKTNALTEKLIRQKMAQRWATKEAKSTFHKHIYFVLTANLDNLQILQLKDIGMTGDELLIFLRIQFKNLKKLVLSHNRISIEKAAYHLQHLKILQQLDLSFNQLQNLPTNLQQLQHLRILNLESNELKQFHDMLKLNSLLSLNLKKNLISQKYCQNIQLANSQLAELFLDGHLQIIAQKNKHNLKKLCLFDLESVQSFNQLLQQQQFLELTLEGCTSFVDFSAKINFNALTALTLRNNQISKLPLKQLTFASLKKIAIEEPHLVQFPIQLLEGRKVQFFQLRSQQLSDLPTQLKFNTSLKSIAISIKELTEFPQFLYQLRQLQVIHLQNLYLFDLASESKVYFISPQIAGLTNLQEIELASMVRVEIDLTNLLQALNSQVMNYPLKRFQLRNFIINSSMFQQITKLGKIQTLTLIDGLIDTLPESIQKLRELTSLNLIKNQISGLPASFFSLKNLQFLNLRQNPIKNIPEKILQLQKLVFFEIDLEQQQLNYQKDIRLAFQLHQRQIEVVQQQKFDIAAFIGSNGSACSYSQLIEQQNDLQFQQHASHYQSYKFNPASYLSALQKFKQLPFYRLTQVSLKDSHLADQDFGLQSLQFTFVKVLDLSKNMLKLGKGQIFFTFLPSLQILDVSSNEIQKLPQDFSSSPYLRKLVISHNRLALIPRQLYTSKNLQILDLSYNQITSVEEEIQLQATCLTRLNLQGNSLKEPPYFISLSQNLLELNISYNSQKLKLGRQLQKHINLENLKANGMSYDDFPSHFFELNSIQHLSIDGFNYPASLQQILIPPARNIVSLSLEGYRFSQIPQGLYELRTLEKLNLSNNDIQTIDSGISQLQVLKTLELRFNKINCGCINLTKIQTLQLVDLNFNEIADTSQRGLKLQFFIALLKSKQRKVGVQSATILHVKYDLDFWKVWSDIEQLSEQNKLVDSLIKPTAEMINQEQLLIKEIQLIEIIGCY